MGKYMASCKLSYWRLSENATSMKSHPIWLCISNLATEPTPKKGIKSLRYGRAVYAFCKLYCEQIDIICIGSMDLGASLPLWQVQLDDLGIVVGQELVLLIDLRPHGYAIPT